MKKMTEIRTYGEMVLSKLEGMVISMSGRVAGMPIEDSR
jgi:hypothetical protein